MSTTPFGWNTQGMKRLEHTRSGFALLPALTLLALGLTACTSDAPPEHSGPSHPAQSMTSTDTSSPTASSSLDASAQATSPQATSPTSGQTDTVSPSVSQTGSGNAQHGLISLGIDAPDLPAGSLCQGFAQRTDDVQSGGGGLGGAPSKLEGLQATGATEVSLLPGTYEITVNCSENNKSWAGTTADIRVKRGASIDVLVKLTAKS